MRRLNLRNKLLLSAVVCVAVFDVIRYVKAQSPLQWNYSFDSAGLAFANYPGKVGYNGEISTGTVFTVTGCSASAAVEIGRASCRERV